MQKEEYLEIFERYVQQRASEDEIKRLSDWIRNNRNISEWMEQQILNSEADMDASVQLRMLERIKHQLTTGDQPSAQPGVKFRIQTWWRIAAMLVLPLLTALGMYVYMSRYDSGAPVMVAVERGQKATVTLPDGSKVWLNSLSELRYTPGFTSRKRELQLEGEAYFEVAPDPDRPFVVTGTDLKVEALGTSFGMKTYREDRMVSSILMSGKVRVTTPDGTRVLKPNERIQYDKTTAQSKHSQVANATEFTGWIRNELRFENETLDEIARSIQRIYNVEIIFASENLKQLRYTGTVQNNSLESVLNIITLTSPLSFQIDKHTIILYENENLMQHYRP